jgi:hypothetical protein
LFLCGCLFAVGLLFLRGEQLRTNLRNAVDELRAARESLAVARVERGAFLELANEKGWTGGFLTGIVAQSGGSVSYERPPDGIYYLIRSTCAACPVNFPAIDRLRAAAPERILIVAYDEAARSLNGYIEQHGVTAPVIHEARGRLVSNIREYATPLTMRFEGGRLVELITGRIDQDTESHLASALIQLHDPETVE